MQVGNAFLTKAEERRDGSLLSAPPGRSHTGFRSAVKMKNGNFVLSSNEAVVGTVCSCAHYALSTAYAALFGTGKFWRLPEELIKLIAHSASHSRLASGHSCATRHVLLWCGAEC